MKKLWVSSLLATLLAVAPAVAADRPSVPVKGAEGPDTRATLPADIPNIYDPAVRGRFVPVMVVNLGDNPDFPTVLLVNTIGEQPEALLVGLDARNGTATWSLTGDPIILIVAFVDELIQRLYVDTGFADLGTASGHYGAVDDVNSPALPDLLRQVTEGATRTYI